jgi:hypothetical protein
MRKIKKNGRKEIKKNGRKKAKNEEEKKSNVILGFGLLLTHTRLWPMASDFVVTVGVAGFCDPLSAHFRMF